MTQQDQPTLHNHMFDLGFTLISDQDNTDKITKGQLIAAARERLQQIETSDEGVWDAFGFCDSYEIEPGDYTYDESYARFESQLRTSIVRTALIKRLRDSVISSLQQLVETLEKG